MKYDLTRLFSDIDKQIMVKENYTMNQEEVKQANILSGRLNVSGIIRKSILNNVEVDLSIKGDLFLPCAITLEPVEYNISVDIDVEIEENDPKFEKNDKKSHNILDIFPIVWENVLMEVPMRVVSKNARLSSLESKSILHNENTERKNPELEKLKDLL